MAAADPGKILQRQKNRGFQSPGYEYRLVRRRCPVTRQHPLLKGSIQPPCPQNIDQSADLCQSLSAADDPAQVADLAAAGWP
jgi:hypothetical protein